MPVERSEDYLHRLIEAALPAAAAAASSADESSPAPSAAAPEASPASADSNSNAQLARVADQVSAAMGALVAAGAAPCGTLRDRSLKHKQREWANHVGLLDRLDERSRRQKAVLGMLPANQTLRAS